MKTHNPQHGSRCEGGFQWQPRTTEHFSIHKSSLHCKKQKSSPTSSRGWRGCLKDNSNVMESWSPATRKPRDFVIQGHSLISSLLVPSSSLPTKYMFMLLFQYPSFLRLLSTQGHYQLVPPSVPFIHVYERESLIVSVLPIGEPRRCPVSYPEPVIVMGKGRFKPCYPWAEVGQSSLCLVQKGKRTTLRGEAKAIDRGNTLH